MAARRKFILCMDLDGTILNSSRAHAEAFKMAFKKNNLPFRSSDEIVTSLGPPAKKVIKILHPKISKRKLEKTVKDKHDFLLKKTAAFISKIPGSVAALKELKQYFKLALVSNSIHSEIIALLNAAKISLRTFDIILGGDEIKPKPSKDIVKNIEKLAKAKVAYFIGDTIYDIRTGKAANVKTIAVLSGIHAVKKLGAEDPTIIIENISILPDILLGRL